MALSVAVLVFLASLSREVAEGQTHRQNERLNHLLQTRTHQWIQGLEHLAGTEFAALTVQVEDSASGERVYGPAALQSGPTMAGVLHLPWRTWQYSAQVPPPQAGLADLARWLVLLTGMGLAVAAAMWVHSLEGAQSRIAHEVERQTRELRTSTEALRQARDVAGEAVRAADDARDEAFRALRAREDFLAVVSHELRTPMNGILGTTQLLLQSGLSHDQELLAARPLSSGQALLALLNDLLDTAKLDAGMVQLEETAFTEADIVDTVASLMRPGFAQKGVELRVSTSARPGDGWRGDAGRVRQIVQNFVSNALKFTDRGTVELASHVEPTDDGAGVLVVRCIDSGIGVPADQLETVFEPFTQADLSTSRQYGGTGPGLTICRRFAHLMGGEEGVESEEGAGATFWLRVPVTRCAAPVAPAPPPTSRPAPVATPLRVLVVDDNPVNQLVAKSMLEAVGHEVQTAGDGHEAVEAARRFPFDAVVMDVQMPRMDGKTATRVLRGSPPPLDALPIIGLSASSMNGAREACLKAGMTEFLTKPVRHEALLAAVQRCLPRGRSASA